MLYTQNLKYSTNSVLKLSFQVGDKNNQRRLNRKDIHFLILALGMDALEHTHPIEVPLKDASEISQVFDKITYCKGASVIFMLHQFIGPEKFRSGIRDYIQHFSVRQWFMVYMVYENTM